MPAMVGHRFVCRARLAQYVCLLCAGLTQLAHEVVLFLCMYKENIRTCDSDYR